jgi:hypothetical protein
MKRRKIARGIIWLISFLLGLFLYLAYQEGHGHVDAWSTFRWAKESWQSGEKVKAAEYFVQASVMSIDGGARHLIAKPYFASVNNYLTEGDKIRALEKCVIGLRILGRYDDEGSFGNFCYQIEFQIENPELLK